MPRYKHLFKYRLRFLAEKAGLKIRLAQNPVSKPIDYSRSKAYMITSYYLYINPSLSEDFRKGVEESIRSVLYAVSKRLPLKAYKGEEYFWGPFASNAPDYVILPEDPKVNVSTNMLSNRLVEKGKWFIHEPHNLIIIKHPLMKKNMVVNMTEFDIVPTILYYLGLSLPHDTDGRVPRILKLIDEHSIKYRDYSGIYRSIKKLRRITSAL